MLGNVESNQKLLKCLSIQKWDLLQRNANSNKILSSL